MGAREYWDKKTTVEECADLSIFRLNEWRHLKGRHNGTLTWTRKLSGSRTSVGLVVDVMDNEPYVEVRYTVTGRNDGSKQDYNYRIGLVTTPCNLGGVRYWFICPGCGWRVAKLYLRGDSRMFLCRVCNKLSYQSRNESRLWRHGGPMYMCACDRKAKELRETVRRYTWRGMPTRKMRRLQKLEQKSHHITYHPRRFMKYGIQLW